MVQEKMLTIMGSPGSGKTTTAIKLARALAAERNNVIVVLCDPFTPAIPSLIPAGMTHDTSFGLLLTSPGITQKNILDACVPVAGSGYISLLGYRMGESLMSYPKVTRDRALEVFVLLRYLADYVIIDSTTVLEADPASFVAIETADIVLKMGTANLKGVSWFRTHAPMLSDSRYRKGSHFMAVGNLKAGQDWEAVAGEFGGVDYVLPYSEELEQQDHEMNLFLPLFSPESKSYQAEISHILRDIFSFPEKMETDTVLYSNEGMKKDHGRMKWKLPFSGNRGEF